MAELGKLVDDPNGGHYGPPVPPHRQSSHTDGGSSSSFCCSLLYSLMWSLFLSLITLIIFIVVIIAVIWFVFRPNELKSYVKEAKFTQFNLIGNTLSYNLSVNLSIGYNPNKRVTIYYDKLQATTSYHGSWFGYDNKLPIFFHDHKNTTIIYPTFNGQPLIPPTTASGRQFGKEKGDGWFYIDMNVKTNARFEVWLFKSNSYTPEIDCKLKLQVPSPSDVFTRTKCSITYFDHWVETW